MGAYKNKVNDFGKAEAAFVAMPETRQTAQPQKLNATNIIRKGAAPYRKIGLPLNSLFLYLYKQPPFCRYHQF